MGGRERKWFLRQFWGFWNSPGGENSIFVGEALFLSEK
jgi:hypothetical protein